MQINALFMYISLFFLMNNSTIVVASSSLTDTAKQNFLTWQVYQKKAEQGVFGQSFSRDTFSPSVQKAYGKCLKQADSNFEKIRDCQKIFDDFALILEIKTGK